MKKLLTLITLLSIAYLSYGQILSDFGIYIQGSASTQLLNNPKVSEDGTFAWNFIYSGGAGVYAAHRINDKLFIRNNINYSRKGAELPYQAPDNTGQIQYLTLVNKFHYLSLDGLLQYKIGNRTNHPYISLGLRGDLLLASDTPDPIEHPNGGANIDPEDYNQMTLGWLANVGLNIDKLVFVEIGANYDFTPALDQADASVKNLIWSLNIGLNIAEAVRNSF